MSAIRVSETANGFAVEFPFRLKDQFKATFPSAKWDPVLKVWIVGPRSRTRLDQWVAAASQVAETIVEAEQAELTEQELADVRAQMTSLRQAIEDARGTRNALKAVRELLAADKAKLEEVRETHAQEVHEAKASKQSLIAMLAGIVDFNAVNAAVVKMAKAHDGVGRRNRDDFHTAQAVIAREHNRLLEAGYRSRGLAELASANFNRPDRDHPKFVTEAMILDISRAEKTEEAP